MIKRQFCTVWDNGLKERFQKLFQQTAVGQNGGASIPIAQFVSSLYDLNVLEKKEWPVSRILEDMHQRGYARDVFTKPSYGAESPPPLTEHESLNWLAYFRVRSLNNK